MAKLNLFFTIIFFILLSSCYISPCLCCPAYQKQALLQFKSLLLGNNSYNSSHADLVGLESWNSSSDCCRWDWVVCNSNRNLKQVTSLFLAALTPNIPFLKGTVVKSNVLTPLFHLRTLKLLDISSNYIQGEIPGAGIANLTELEFLRMDWNRFNGSIPRSLSHLKSLNYLDLGWNSFSMEIPSYIGNLSGLWHLSLRDNHLWGEIPPSLRKMEQLKRLDLSNNYLIGAVPEWLAKMNLEKLVLSDNMLTGSLPSCLFQSPMLMVLDLSRNNLSGRLPDSIGEAMELRKLLLSDNNFFGPVPKSFSNMSLAFLDLSINKFSGDLFPIFGPNFNSIRFVELSQNKFSGVLPQNLINFSNLVVLDLHDNHITGEMMSFLTKNSLKFLNLRNNFFQGPIPNFWSNFSKLQILDLSHNNFSGKVPPSLGELRGMINPKSEFWWEICPPTSPCKLVLEDLPGFSTSPVLEVFWKKLEVKLPNQKIMLYAFLDLSNNQLSGEIPNTLSRLEGLKLLNISYNKLSGKIPLTIGDLKNLESLDLSHNNLTGEIPQTFQNLLQLTNLDLSNNKLTGRIPNGPQMNTFNNPSTYANNSGLCGMQIQLPCEKQSPKTMPAETKSSMREGNDTWFSWKMAGIGFPAGFFSTIAVLYISGYFNVAPQRRRGRLSVRQFI